MASRAERKTERKAAVERLRQAREELAAYRSTTGDGFSDPEWVRRNDAVGDAEKAVRFGRHRGWNYYDPYDK